ncbi:MAG: hypothetical protein ONB46_16130 [candidate division KSB1 bacterium]|nr:hypothetical protein [candidate division KSB1 bacterium]MDZ7367315.1 hypothetical protein [candidate division KSB1 bacterium]MDZ7405846.1 hypothetical protein [candidate division KSB1 bacterium]
MPHYHASRVKIIGGMLLLLAGLACQSPQTQPLDLGVVTLQADAGWQTTAPTSMMRKAQFTLPRAAGDSEDAELVVFYFGADQGGSVEANLNRWYTQFSQPDGSASSEKATVTREVVDEMNLTTVDLSGTYVAPVMPGNDEQYNKPNFRMLAAVLETAQGPYFFKLVGPEKTVAKWAKSFSQFMKSAKRSQ